VLSWVDKRGNSTHPECPSSHDPRTVDTSSSESRTVLTLVCSTVCTWRLRPFLSHRRPRLRFPL